MNKLLKEDDIKFICFIGRVNFISGCLLLVYSLSKAYKGEMHPLMFAVFFFTGFVGFMISSVIFEKIGKGLLTLQIKTKEEEGTPENILPPDSEEYES